MGHLDRTPARAVRRHREEPVVRLLDLAHDRAAALAPGGARIFLRSLESEGARLHEVARLVLGLHELRELGLSHRPPGHVRDVDEPPGEIAPDERAVGRVRQRRVQAPDALEPRLESGLALAASRVPRLEVVQDGAELDERMDRGILERHEPRSGRIAGDERLAIEREDSVRLLGPPERRVGKEGDEEVRRGIPQRVANSLGIAVRHEVFVERGDFRAAEALAIAEDLHVRADRLSGDLLARPRLEVDRAGRRDLFALADLPRVGAGVRHEGLRIEEPQRRSGQEGLRPRLVLEKADGRLVPVQRGAELDLADERLRLVLLVAGRPRRLAYLRDALRGLLELLLRDEAFDFLPRGGAAGRAGVFGERTGQRDRAGGREGCCAEAEEREAARSDLHDSSASL